MRGLWIGLLLVAFGCSRVVTPPLTVLTVRLSPGWLPAGGLSPLIVNSMPLFGVTVMVSPVTLLPDIIEALLEFRITEPMPV